MKIAVAFLSVALSCSFCYGFIGVTGQRGAKAEAADVPSIPKECLQKLLKFDVPEVLKKLQDLLCLYMEGKKENNEKLYKEFLKQLHETLKDVGCTVDEILSTKEFLEKITDKVGETADKLVFEILKLAEGLGVLGTVLNTLCGLLGETLGNLSNVLAGGDVPLLKGLLG